MSWNYRIVKDTKFGHYSIKEVYYDENNRPKGYCTCSLEGWENLAQLESTINQMRAATFRSVLVVDSSNKLTEIEENSGN